MLNLSILRYLQHQQLKCSKHNSHVIRVHSLILLRYLSLCNLSSEQVRSNISWFIRCEKVRLKFYPWIMEGNKRRNNPFYQSLRKMTYGRWWSCKHKFSWLIWVRTTELLQLFMATHNQASHSSLKFMQSKVKIWWKTSRE